MEKIKLFKLLMENEVLITLKQGLEALGSNPYASLTKTPSSLCDVN